MKITKLTSTSNEVASHHGTSGRPVPGEAIRLRWDRASQRIFKDAQRRIALERSWIAQSDS